MDDRAAAWLVIALAVIAANLPFLSERLFLVLRAGQPKRMTLRLIELVVYAAIVTGAGVALEARQGQAHAQGWAFYAVVACIFCTLAFPGFVWRCLKRHRPASHAT